MPLVVRRLYDVNATLCNPYLSLSFVHEPLGGYANSFRALRGIIALAFIVNASVSSGYSSLISFVATWKSYCSLLDESISCICRCNTFVVSLL